MDKPRETEDFSDLIITGIHRVVAVQLKENYSRRSIDRPANGLIVTPEGQVSYQDQNAILISDARHPLLLSKGISYTFRSLTASRSIVINFSTAQPLPFAGIRRYELDLISGASRIENLWTFHKNAAQLKCIAWLYAFFARQSQAKNFPAYIPSSALKSIQPSIDYIEAHYTDLALSNEILARQSGISTVYFRKLFAKAFGMAPMQFVHQKRIERAKNLLQSEFGISISDVAEAAGFASVYQFSRSFRQAASCSPSEYRRQAGEKNRRSL